MGPTPSADPPCMGYERCTDTYCRAFDEQEDVAVSIVISIINMQCFAGVTSIVYEAQSQTKVTTLLGADCDGTDVVGRPTVYGLQVIHRRHLLLRIWRTRWWYGKYCNHMHLICSALLLLRITSYLSKLQCSTSENEVRAPRPIRHALSANINGVRPRGARAGEYVAQLFLTRSVACQARICVFCLIQTGPNSYASSNLNHILSSCTIKNPSLPLKHFRILTSFHHSADP